MHKVKKKEYFTFMFLPGPFSRVRTISISKVVIKSVLFSLFGILIISLYLIYDYIDMKDKLQGSGPVNEIPLSIFIGIMILVNIIVFFMKLLQKKRSSQASVIKNKLIEYFCAVLDMSPIKPRK